MFAFFQNPHLFIILHSILISVAAYGYSRVTQKDEKEHMKTFWKTLLISLVIGLVLVYFVYRKEQVSSEPFQATPQLGQTSIGI
jgi:uncharacterized membrane protein affecting hemolysin expression